MKIFNKVSVALLVVPLVLVLAGSSAAFAKKAPTPVGPAVVNLGTAGNFVILSKAGISTTGVTKIT